MVWLPISVYFSVCISLSTHTWVAEKYFLIWPNFKIKKKSSRWELSAPPCICDFLKCAFFPYSLTCKSLCIFPTAIINDLGLTIDLTLTVRENELRMKCHSQLIDGKIFLQMICKLFQLKSFVRKLEFFSNLWRLLKMTHTWLRLKNWSGNVRNKITKTKLQTFISYNKKEWNNSLFIRAMTEFQWFQTVMFSLYVFFVAIQLTSVCPKAPLHEPPNQTNYFFAFIQWIFTEYVREWQGTVCVVKTCWTMRVSHSGSKRHSRKTWLSRILSCVVSKIPKYWVGRSSTVGKSIIASFWLLHWNTLAPYLLKAPLETNSII